MAQLKDLLVSGVSRFIGKLFANEAQVTTLNIPTASNGTTYGPGTSGQYIRTNGTSLYWDSLDAADIPNISADKITSGTLPVNRGGTGRASLDAGKALVGNSTNAVELREILNNTSVGALGWNSAGSSNANNLRLVNVNTIAYWNGAYSGTSSNLSVLGTVTTGTWQGTTVGVGYGGTGKTSWTKFGVLYASETNALSNTAAGTAGLVLQSGGGSAAPSWLSQSSITAGYASKLTAIGTGDNASSTDGWRKVWISYADGTTGRPALTDALAFLTSTGTLKATKFSGDGSGLTNLSAANISAGTLPVARGGTNATSVTKYGVAYGNASANAYAFTGAGTSGYLLQSGGGSAAPSWKNPADLDVNTAKTLKTARNISVGDITKSFNGSADISFPTKDMGIKYMDLNPTVSKKYESTSYYATSSGSWETSTWYFMSVKPTAWYKPWTVRFKVHTFEPSYSNAESISYCTVSGREQSFVYANWNERYDTAHYYTTIYPLKKAGFDAGYGHAIGISILYGYNYTNSAHYRTFEIDYYDCDNCEVTLLDTPVQWASWTGTGSTNYNGINSMNAVDRGLQESGDANDYTTIRSYYDRITAGTNGLKQYSLAMLDSTGAWQSFTTDYGTGTSKTKNTTGFILGDIVYLNTSSNTTNGNIVGWNVVTRYQGLIDYRYTFNCGTGLTANKMVYIVGSLGTDGLFYLADTWWTLTLPTSEDGKLYIPVGIPYPDSGPYRGDFSGWHTPLWYKDGKVIPFYNNAVRQTAVTASSYTNWRSLIWGSANSGTEGFTPTTVTDRVYSTSTLSVQPSTGTIKATTFKGALSGNVTGNASSATKLLTARTIWGQSFNGTANISGNMIDMGPQVKLPSGLTTWQFLTSTGGAGYANFGRLGLNGTYANIDLTNYVLDVSGKTRVSDTIYRAFTASNAGPMLWMNGNDYDNWLFTISSGTSNNMYFGFGLKYIGTGSGNANYLDLYADNQNGTEVLALRVDLAGTLTGKQLTLTGNLTVNGDAYLNSNTYAEGITANTLIVNGASNLIGVTTHSNNVLPNTTNAYSLGTSSARWSKLYVGTTDSYGSGTQPIYWDAGVPKACSYSISATINSSTATYMAYYSGANAISGTSYARMIDGCLNLYPANSNYREGIRIHPYGGWSDITLMGNTNTNTSGIAATDWFIGNNSGTFYITHAGSSSSSTGYLKASTENSAGYWQFYQRVGINGISNTHNFYVNGTSKFNGGIIANEGTAAVAVDNGSSSSNRYLPTRWTFNLGIAASLLASGLVVIIKMPSVGHDYGVFLSVDNGTTFKPISSNTGTNRLTTHYPNGTVLVLCYDANGSTNSVFPVAGSTARTNVTGGCWRPISSYDDGNPGEWNLRQYTIKALTAITAVHLIGGTDSGYNHIDSGTAFDIRYSVLYAGSNISAGSAGNNNFIHHYAVNVKNSSGSNISNFTSYKNVYIKGTLNGNIFTPISGGNPYVQDITAEEDGYVYYYIGRAYTTNAITFDATAQSIYCYKDGAVRPYEDYSSLSNGYAYPYGKSDKPWHLVAEFNLSTNGQLINTKIVFLVSNFYSDEKSGILEVAVRWESNGTTPGFIRNNWLVCKGLTPSDFITTWKYDSSTKMVNIHVYAKLTGWTSLNFTRLAEHNWGMTKKEWIFHRVTYSSSYALASIPADETQVTSTITDIKNNAATATSATTASKATAANITTTANAVAYYTDTTGTFGSKASANGALYATSANGALLWGTLPAAQGGTGKTTLKDACNALINALDTGSSNLTANDYVITQYVGGGTTTTTYHRRPASAIRVGGLLTARKLKVALGSTTDVTFDGTADQTSIPVSGTLAIAHGGTGATTAADARTNLGLGSMATETATNYLKWQTTTAASTALYDFGVYVNLNNAAGTGMTGGNYFQIINIPYRKASGNTIADWGFLIGNTTANDGRLWYRTSGSNVWGDWQTIAHATQSTSNTGSATQPVYMTAAGVITAGTALKDLAYIAKPSSNQTTTFLRGDGTWQAANNYSLPLAANGTRGGVQIGYTTSGQNYAVQLSSEKMYVNVPWTDTKVTQSASTASNWRKILLHYKDDATSTTAVTTSTNLVYAAVDISALASTGTIRANHYKVTDNGTITYNTSNGCIEIIVT